ncbi:hypothetical protein SY83_01815 [Paenibacillus swuensis]|uniref:Methyltransferase type 11 domain-containing protein n=1 Tax=Paenibacillus swuensis TaxID=1178515 RepID=A0A172TED7_9BACL|nr:class I SAM-dependent methyltransferase [Paenibacillus swuensis]ANE45274.1 hypothetical protein SY83_01815 [Paenibacillus swuensis]
MGTEDSRFFKVSDPHSDEVLFRIPHYWWSRLYEYEWAKNFVRPGDVVLDAACGIDHPFKFYLTTVTDQVYACDIDPRIVMPEQVIESMRGSFFGAEAAEVVRNQYVDRVQFAHADLTRLPYADASFDRVFCISVLEEMPAQACLSALKEFRRVLRPDGLVVLTFDYPNIDLALLREQLEEADLAVAGPVDWELPEDALYTEMWGGLYCFRALLKRK